MVTADRDEHPYSLNYDLTLSGDLCKGQLIYRNGALEAVDDDTVVYSIPIKEVNELKLTSNVGCAFIECKHNDEDRMLCRFTMGYLYDAGEFCKIINYYIQNGCDAGDISAEKEVTVCPECGRRLIQNTNVCFFCVKKLQIYKKAFNLMADFKRPLIIMALLLALSNLLYILTPVLNRILIDDYLKPRRGSIYEIALLCGIMFLLRAGGEVIFIFSSRISTKTSGSIANTLRCSLYSKVQQLSMSSMSRKTSGDLMKRITQDTQKVRDFIIDQGRWAFERVFAFVAVAVILFVSSPALAIMVFVPIPLAIFIINRFWSFIFKRYNKQWILQSRSNAILHDIIKGIRVVKTFGNEDREIAKFDKSCKVLADVSSENEKLWSKIFPTLGFLIGTGEFLVLYFGGKAVMGRELSIGELVQFTMYLAFIYEPLRWMTQIPRWVADLTASLVKLFEILDEELEIKDSEEMVEPEIRGAIDFKDVVFGYKSYEPVLKNITLDIKPGEMIGIVGPSGVGKSTFINLIMRLYEINGGSISIDGTDIKSISQKSLHESIGVVFQETFLFAGSLYENITYAKPDATYDEVIAASKIANAHEFIIKLPDAYNTLVGENGYTLSGGERQRIAIARAVLRNPSILILDEATASLDVETEGKIQEALSRLTKGRTTIAIAHRLSTLRNADRLIVLDKGHLAEIGSHVELLRNKGIYYKLVMAQRQTAKLKDGSESGQENAISA